MNTKTVISSIALALTLSAGAFAMHHEDGERGPGDGKRLEKMAQHLDLSDEQKSQVAQIMKAQGEKRKAMMEAHKAQRDAMQADMRSQLSGVLTPEQMQKLDNMREERDERREEKMEKWKEKREKHKERY
jgi:protein CpxP